MAFGIRIIKPTALLIVLFVFSHTTFAQSFQERTSSIKTTLESGNVSERLVALKSLRDSDPSLFALNNFDYLYARLLEQQGDRAGALSGYRTIAHRRSLLSQYAVWHIAQLARASGDLVQEREQLRQLLILAPGSLLREAATFRLAESFFDSKDYLSAIATFRPLTTSTKLSLARQALMRSGQAYVLAGKNTEAREAFTTLVETVPNATQPDDFALAAVRALDFLDKASATAISETVHWQRAGIFQFNRDFDGARLHYQAIVTQFPSSSFVPESLFQIGRGLYQQEKYDEAIKYLSRAREQFASSSSARDATALTAGAYVRLKRPDDAIATYKLYIEQFPDAPNPERPYLNLIDIMRDAGRFQEALSWVQQTRQHFKEQPAGTLALFSQARIHIAQGSWRAALSDLEELTQAKDLGGSRTAGGTSSSEVNFLRGLVLEQLGRSQDALDAYLAIPEGRNEYYGFRANQRLIAITSNSNASVNKLRADLLPGLPNRLLETGQYEPARQAAQNQLRIETDPARRKDLLRIANSSYAALPTYKFPSFQLLSLGRHYVIESAPAEEPSLTHQRLADELLFLGLYDEATPELVAARGETAPSVIANQNVVTAPGGDLAYTEAVFFLRGGVPYPAVRFAEQIWRTVPADYLLELAPRPMTEMLYPAAFRNSVTKYSRAQELDPRFVLSIARQETRFQADAKSAAAARGLMQFIAATATQTARELGRQDFDQDELYNPDTALQFGTKYLSSLFRQLPNQLPAVAAAYNGGPDNIARWIKRSGSKDPDRYVPEIGFAQTKDYVFRVMCNYWVYQKLYDDNLQPLPNNQ